MYFKKSILTKPTIFSAETLRQSCIRKVLSLVLLITFLFNLCSCSSLLPTYKLTVSFEFADMSDESIIETRLNAFMFDIKSKETDGNKVTYTLERKEYVQSNLFELICSRDVVSIEDKNGDVILTREEVSSVEFESDLIIAQVPEDRYEKLTRGPCYFVLGDTSVWADFEDKNAETYTVRVYPPRGVVEKTISGDGVVYIKGALTLISEPPKGEVNATIMETNIVD